MYGIGNIWQNSTNEHETGTLVTIGVMDLRHKLKQRKILGQQSYTQRQF